MVLRKLTRLFKLWYRTKFVKPAEVDFSEAKMFDEEDRLNEELASQTCVAAERNRGMVVWEKAKDLVLG